MADDSELDYIKTFLEYVHAGTAEFTDTIDSVDTGDDKIVLDNEHAGAVENEFTGYIFHVTIGDDIGEAYIVDVNDGNTPTTFEVTTDIPADLAGDTVALYAPNAGHTVATIETTKNIHMINDTQSILVYAGQSLSADRIMMKRQYALQYKDASEAALNAAIYALCEGIDKLNARETISGYIKPNSLVGMSFLSSGKDYHQMTAGNWYANIQIIAKWLTS